MDRERFEQLKQKENEILRGRPVGGVVNGYGADNGLTPEQTIGFINKQSAADEDWKVAKAFYAVSLDCIGRLLRSEVHEYRLCALLMLVEKYRKAADRKQAESVFDFYMANLERANNWDLVDLSAPYILGEHVIGTGHSAVLHDLVKSGNMWRRRAAVVSTLPLVRKGHLDEAMCLAAAVMDDAEELLWKAGGWVLREAGKKDEKRLTGFLDDNAAIMPRVMLRYAIERLPGDLRKHYMSLKNK